MDNASGGHGWLRSPDGTRYEFYNLTQWVRDHAHLFYFDEVIWVPNGCTKPGCTPQLRCKASRGLGRVIAGRQNSWKGWTEWWPAKESGI